MNILSFIASIALAITLIQGFYILFRDYRSESNRIFFFICLCISTWLFGCAFGYSAHTKEDAFFWLKVASPGFIFLHPLVLHFALRYTETVKSKLLYIIYIPSFYFLYISITGHLVFSDIYRYGEYWLMVPDYEAPSFYLLMVNYLSYYIISLILLYKNIKNTKSFRMRSKSRIIFAAIIVTIASYNIEPFLAPIFFDYHTYGQAPLYSIAWISLIWYAMTKYRFLGVYEKFLSLDVLDSLNEMVIITDCRKRIFKVNLALMDKIAAHDPPHSLSQIIVEKDLIERIMDTMKVEYVSDIKLNLKIPEGKTVPINADISCFKDRFGDYVGFIITARGIEDSHANLKNKGITEREFQLIQLVLSGNSNKQISEFLGISLRTVETHVTHIYEKLGLTRRSELVNYCTNMFNPSSSPSPDSAE
jgi:DNA-binding CsgD family transcriptional regulator